MYINQNFRVTPGSCAAHLESCAAHSLDKTALNLTLFANLIVLKMSGEKSFGMWKRGLRRFIYIQDYFKNL